MMKKEEWREMSEKQKEQMQGMIKNLTDTWQENPETIAEMLEFGSRIYRYKHAEQYADLFPEPLCNLCTEF